MEEQNNEGTMKDLLKRIKEQNDMLLETKQTKAWKLPRRARLSKAKIRKGYATIHLIKHNGDFQHFKAPIDDDGCVDIEGFPRIATADYRLIDNGKPAYIFKEWSMKPVSVLEELEKDEQERMNIYGRKLVLARLQREQIKPTKKGLGGVGMWVILGLIVLGGAYYLMKGGKLF